MHSPRKSKRPGPLPHQKRLRDALELGRAKAAAHGTVKWVFSDFQTMFPESPASEPRLEE